MVRRLVPKDVLNIQGALYFCTFFMGIVNSLIVQPVAAAERTVFYRERAARLYSVAAYSLSLVCQRPPSTQFTNHLTIASAVPTCCRVLRV